MGYTQPKSLVGITLVILVMLFALACTAYAGNITVHSSGRYYQDASGKPMFLIGYYGWAAVPDGYYIDHPPGTKHDHPGRAVQDQLHPHQPRRQPFHQSTNPKAGMQSHPSSVHST